MSILEGLLALVVAWMVVGAAGLLRPRDVRWAGRVMFVAGAAIGVGVAALALAALEGAAVEHLVLPLGLPDLPFHVRLDPLAAVFLFLIGSTSVGVSIYSAGYFRAGEGAAPGLLCLQYHVFLAAMALVVLADDAYLFMVAWETMALTSYFLVTTQHRVAEIRAAGFLYLIVAHVGALGILLSFGVLQGGSWQFTFDAMRAASLPSGWASVAFALALFGFGAKAGVVPLHVWLPEAHPAAPSPVSALMSGVMIKTAIYGLIRVSFDLLHAPIWWWGVAVLALGAFTAIYGVIFAAVQTDMKRLLAYSSIENIGLILAGLGLAMLFRGVRMDTLAALTLGATIYHSLNHAQMKSLLFLATGSVLHATGERNLGKLGGLIHKMPWVAWLALVGTLAMAGLPPLNGFASEWLMLQAFLFTPSVPHPIVNMLAPLGAASIALTIALAAYVMVKFYGVIFLGRPRERALERAHDAGWLERAGLAWLAILCVLLGLAPAAVLARLDAVSLSLVGSSIGGVGTSGWLLAPITPTRSSYGAPALAAVIVIAVLATFVAVRVLFHGRVRRADPWDCGFPAQTARMQDTAEGFGQPIRHVFGPFFRIERDLPTPFDREPRYALRLFDRFWDWLYAPVAVAVQGVARAIGVLQQGRIAVYLLYSFVTLIALLVFVL